MIWRTIIDLFIGVNAGLAISLLRNKTWVQARYYRQGITNIIDPESGVEFTDVPTIIAELQFLLDQEPRK